MAKVKSKVVVKKCQCTVCGQVAFVQEGTSHFYCNGIKLVKPLPPMFKDLRHPDPARKGMWMIASEVVLAEVLQGATSEPKVA